MSAEPQKLRRKAAKRPAPRTVSVTGTGEFAGWEATARADFPARLVEDLLSGDINRIISVLDAIVVDHNMPNSDDEIASTMADVDPYTGLMELAGEIFDAIGKLPNR